MKNVLKTAGIILFILLCLLVGTKLMGQSDHLNGLLQTILDKDRSDLKPILVDYCKGLEALTNAEREKKALEAITKLEKAPDSEGIIFALQQLGEFYENHKLPTASIRFFQLAYKKAEKSNSRLQMGITLKHIAMVYRNQDMLTESLTYIYQALKIFEDRKVYTKAIITLYEASLINYKAANFEDAVNDFYSALELYQKLPPDSISKDLKFFIMGGWNTTGLSYKALNKTHEALEAYTHASQLAHNINNKFWQGLIDGNKGEVFRQMGQLDEAIQLINEDMKVSLEFDEFQSAALSSCTLCVIYSKKNDLGKAKSYLDTARILFNKLPPSSGTQGRFLVAASEYYSVAGDYKNAYQALLKNKTMTDSSISEERLLSLSRVKAKYELEKKQNEIQLLSQMNDLQSQQIKSQKILLFASLLIIVLIIGFLLYAGVSYRSLKKNNTTIAAQREEIELKNKELEAQSQILKKQNEWVQANNLNLEVKVKERTEQLQNTNEELDTFLYFASHDIRRPIATLLGLEQVSRLSDENPKTKYLFDNVAGTARAMDGMLSKLQMAHELNQPLIDRSWISLHGVINEAAKRFDSDFYRLKIDYTQTQSTLISCYASHNLLLIIFFNLIENAIHFRKAHGEEKSFIRISSHQDDQLVTVTVEDNGMGIESLYLEKIFEFHFRGTQKSKGNGLGLYLVKKAAFLLGGTISVTSEFGVGSIFTFRFPVSKQIKI